MPDRIRTKDLLAMISMAVPAREIMETFWTIAVLRNPLVAFRRRGDAWEALVVSADEESTVVADMVSAKARPADIAVVLGRALEGDTRGSGPRVQRQVVFRTADEAAELLEELFPITDQVADELWARGSGRVG